MPKESKKNYKPTQTPRTLRDVYKNLNDPYKDESYGDESAKNPMSYKQLMEYHKSLGYGGKKVKSRKMSKTRKTYKMSKSRKSRKMRR